MAKLYWQVSTQRTVYLKNSHHAMKPWHPWCLFDQRLGRDQRHLSASGCLFYEEPFSSIESVESISQSSRCCSGRDTFCLLGFDWNENDGWDYTWRCGSGESLPYCRTSLYAQSIKPFLIFWIVMSNQCVALRWANYFGYHERAALTPQPLCSCNTSWPRASGHWHKFLWERAVKQASSKASRSCHATSSRRPWGTLHQPPRHRSPRSGLPVFLGKFMLIHSCFCKVGPFFIGAFSEGLESISNGDHCCRPSCGAGETQLALGPNCLDKLWKFLSTERRPLLDLTFFWCFVWFLIFGRHGILGRAWAASLKHLTQWRTLCSNLFVRWGWWTARNLVQPKSWFGGSKGLL